MEKKLLTLLLFIFSLSPKMGHAESIRCNQIFSSSSLDGLPTNSNMPKKIYKRKFKLTPEQVKQVQEYSPQFFNKLETFLYMLSEFRFEQQILTTERLFSRSLIKNQKEPEFNSRISMLNKIPPNVLNEIFKTHSLLADVNKISAFIEEISYEAAYLMMTNPEAKTKMEYSMDQLIMKPRPPRPSTTKGQLLKSGSIDFQSFMKVLIDRAQSLDLEIAVILKDDKGSFDKNKSRNQKYTSFYDVVKRGPFIDFYFSELSLHGQYVHFFQMVFASENISPPNLKSFWDYLSTVDESGKNWAWDYLFDTFDISTLRSPEQTKIILKEILPIR